MSFWRRRVYLDHSASTPVAAAVRRAMARALRRRWGNASSLHAHGRAARGAVEEARRQVADLLGCGPERILFTSGGSEANNTVVKGVFAQAGGGHIVTTKVEHASVLGACRQIEAQGGRVTYLRAREDGRIRPDDVRGALCPDTILISIVHGSNETGAIQPVEEVGRIAAKAGVPFHTDAGQTYGRIPTQVDVLGCAFLTLTSHMIRGPKGVGVLYWRGETQWAPLVSGGEEEGAQRAGTVAVHQAVGLGAAAVLAKERMESEGERLRALRALFVEELRQAVPDARVNEAPAEHQLPAIVSVTFPGREGLRILAGLDCHGISVAAPTTIKAGRMAPSHVLVGMGHSPEDAFGTVCFSMGSRTRPRHVHRALRALTGVLQQDPAGFGYLAPKELTEQRILSEKTFIVDLRLRHERVLAPTIPGAVEWTLSRLGRAPRDREVILVCSTGARSVAGGYRLARAGHPAVRVVHGGYAAWQAIYPTLIARLKGED